MVFFVGTFGLNFQMTSALMAQREFHRDAQAYGIPGTLSAVGSLAGALIAARRRSARRRGSSSVWPCLAGRGGRRTGAQVRGVCGVLPV
jgi:hypothetical protein